MPTIFMATFPVPAPMREDEIAGDYERETGQVIIETFQQAKRDPQQVPGVLVYSHGPFAWEKRRRMRCIMRW
ncbi:L-ribulose-5-phosphate 4-epimerase SgbE [Serratia fonticola]|uniref:L-ribulose-5-phosphate 4-epimerase SgbE n=1 Tax=Serratia fonticola TaxID=47917 RepID=A0A4U9TEC0_SERFO|nr:L-ribulose-5-phosphate 4-epimerase SgbE [Serratia fonticola]